MGWIVIIKMRFIMCYAIYFAFFTYATIVSAKNLTILTIPLNKTVPYNNKELYGDFVNLNWMSMLEVKFTNVKQDLSFIIFQVHSHLYNITLYRTEFLKQKGNYVIGTNVGLHSSTKGGLDTFYVENTNEDVNLKLFIAVHGYSIADPIPGGCNSETTDSEIIPFMNVIPYNKKYITVTAPPVQTMNDINCLLRSPSIKFYLLYLPEKNYDPDVYFDAIRKMTIKSTIEKYGRIIPLPAQRFWNMRRRVSAYPGIGAIYVTVASINSSTYSVYVPSHSYACSPLIDHDCDLIEDSFSMFLSASLFFLGLFICYYGHRFFKSQIMTIGFLSGLVVTYILLSLMFAIEGPSLLIASALSGLCVGAIRLICWWLYGIPIFVIILSSADIGFIIASTIYYVSPGGLFYLQVDFNFWCLFILIILLITMCMLSISYIANLFCCSLVGAYAAIYPIDHYLGSNLKYILINTIRRATVPDFNKAALMPPFQWRDAFLLFVWVGLTTTGFLYQFYQNRSKPPFPPPPKSVRAIPEDPVEPIHPEPGDFSSRNCQSDSTGDYDERTPLLG